MNVYTEGFLSIDSRIAIETAVHALVLTLPLFLISDRSRVRAAVNLISFFYLGMYPLQLNLSSSISVQWVLVGLLLWRSVSEKPLAFSHGNLPRTGINLWWKSIVNRGLVHDVDLKLMQINVKQIMRLGYPCFHSGEKQGLKWIVVFAVITVVQE